MNEERHPLDIPIALEGDQPTLEGVYTPEEQEALDRRFVELFMPDGLKKKESK